MNAERYFQLMEETGEKTYSKVEKYLQNISETSLSKFVNDFVDGRIGNKRRLRSFLVRGVYEALGKSNWQEALDVCAWAELWCIADYLTNDCFDGKSDKCKREISKDPNLFCMSSAIVREISEKALREAAQKLNSSVENKVVELFNELVNDAYHHQWVDYNLKYKGELKEELEEKIEELFTKRYINYEAGNCFGKICGISAILFGTNNNDKSYLKNYGTNFSTSLQIVNDIADIANSGYDLQNRLLTFPLVLTLTKTGKPIYDLPLEEVKKLFIKSGAFEESRKMAMKYGGRAKRALKNIARRDILSSALRFARSNKYYSNLRRLK